jgi:nickel/cobalt transporter (NicO) family protein
MRRALLLAPVLLALAAAPAGAHPLGNFSVNHLTEVRVSSDRIDLRYVLDQAEIPTFQERGLTAAEVLAAKRAEVARGLRVSVDGRPVRLSLEGERLSHPAGEGGLKLSRVELHLRAAASGADVVVRDETFRDRAGWRAIVARPGEGTAVRSSTPIADPTAGLRRYPEGARADQRAARLTVREGQGTVSGPGGAVAGGDLAPGGDPVAGRDGGPGFDPRAPLLVLLLAAFGWGAAHALSPGHGKAMVAAYLVGTRGTRRDALALGVIVTATHTAGVFALGFVALGLSQWVLPEDLYPWLTLASGLLVLGVGLGVLRQRLRKPHSHDHQHHHHQRPTRRGLLAMGASAGLIPCPSALVVLLGALSQHELVLGLLAIVAFSAGLATTISVLGLVVVGAGRALERLPVPSVLARALPVASVSAILIVGLVLTIGAAGEVG